jgi:cellulose synthase/poly-beta-1,6-N-acetylglucosamine synthase-like glycosyltransferase
MNVYYYSEDLIMNLGMIIFFLVFIILLTILIIFLKSLRVIETKKKFHPGISVLIPAYNEEKVIRRTLRTVLKSNYNNFEVILIDDGSTDKTASIAKKFNIKIVNGKHNGKSESLNLGMKFAKFDFIVSLDADTLVDRNFLKEIINPFSDETVGATNGMAFIKPSRIIEHFQAVEFYFNNLIRDSFSKVFNNGIWFFGAAACFRKSLLKKLDGFSTKVLTEDMDISLRIFEHGFKVITVENAHYHTRAANNLKELFVQRMRWFFGGLQCMTKHKKLLRKKSFAVKYLFFNQWFWALFSIIIIPLVIYEVNFWMPSGFLNIFSYLFRWFSFLGPVYVLYMLPVWGLNFINIFGVSAGIITTILILSSIIKFKGKINLSKLLVVFFYFPYTLVLNAILVSAVFKHGFSKKKYFKN